MDSPFPALFDILGTNSVFLIPSGILLVFALTFIPSLLHPGARPASVALAIFCYMMQAFGVLLMTVGSLPTIFSVLAGAGFTTGEYFSLLLLFMVGGLLYLRHEQVALGIEAASRSVPEALYFYLFKTLGIVTATLSGLSLLLVLMLRANEQGLWIAPLVMFLYGAVLTWCTRLPSPGVPRSFQTMPMNPAPLAISKASSPRPPVVKKAAKSAKKGRK